ncbi:sodium-coupled monocarboxylate transporter 1, partial [Elysia marginata]
MDGSVDSQRHLHVWDYVVFAISIAVSLGIGIFYAFMNRWKNNIEEYLMGGRSMGFLPTAVSLVVSFQSAVTMLGIPAECYYNGFQYLWFAVGLALSMMLVVNVGVSMFCSLRITSAYEYLELRFQSKSVRLLASFMGILQNVFWMGVVMYAPAVALEAVSGYPVWNSNVVTTIAAIIYTSLGGLKAVIWTDVFQSIVMLALMLAVLIQGTVEVGGAKQIWDIAEAADPTVRHTFWSLILGSFFVGIGFTYNNSTFQRIACTKNRKEAKRMLYLSSPVFFFGTVVSLYCGITAFSYFQTKQCDPLKSGQITNPNQVAALFSASLSTLSSGLASVGSMVWTDFIQPHVGEMSQSKSTLVIKVIVVLFGCLTCGVSFLVAAIGGTLIQIALSMIFAFSAPQCGMFMLGCFFPRCNAK